MRRDDDERNGLDLRRERLGSGTLRGGPSDRPTWRWERPLGRGGPDGRAACAVLGGWRARAARGVLARGLAQLARGGGHNRGAVIELPLRQRRGPIQISLSVMTTLLLGCARRRRRASLRASF